MGINEALDNLYVCATNAKSETLEEGYYEKCYDRVVEELEQRDKIIDLMARAIDNYDSQLEICQYKNKEDVIKAFEEFKNMINIRKKKREESKNAKD